MGTPLPVPVPSGAGDSLGPAVGMYTVAKGPTVIVQKTRRGLNKNLENLDSPRVPERESVTTPELHLEDGDSPKIVFKQVKMRNNRKSFLQSSISPEHKEIVSFVTEGWMRVKHEMDQDPGRVKYYQENTNPRLSGFEPFDLDAWWGKKLYHNLTNGV